MQSIALPTYERIPGNNNKATFDRVRMTVGLPRYQFNSWEALQNEVKKYREVIEQHNIKLDETNSDDKQTIYNRLQEANDAVSKSGAQAILKIHECAKAGDNETIITLISEALYGHL